VFGKGAAAVWQRARQEIREGHGFSRAIKGVEERRFSAAYSSPKF